MQPSLFRLLVVLATSFFPCWWVTPSHTVNQPFPTYSPSQRSWVDGIMAFWGMYRQEATPFWILGQGYPDTDALGVFREDPVPSIHPAEPGLPLCF